ncbi:hypothetical protein C9374_013324 [Naegleria lovaniensis]|uniref:Uncharacterized protein n=1 Tax=Naegleria lovaniensis TaxID=51637 RepID=A0AA88KQJ0_NAELO|nr:uncharacterized protein C9374_013324 [Naegleria lovaniensis]KAG2391839.1 hypothetical protein C9374_013324 [Naegleria lovaniensis]
MQQQPPPFNHTIIDEDDLVALLPLTESSSSINNNSQVVGSTSTTVTTTMLPAEIHDTSFKQQQQQLLMDESNNPTAEEDTFIIPRLPLTVTTSSFTYRSSSPKTLSGMTTSMVDNTTISTHSSQPTMQQQRVTPGSSHTKSSSSATSIHANSVSTTHSTSSPLTLMVKYVNSNNGKELYSTLIRMEKYPESLEFVQQVTLKRWNDKCEIVNTNLQPTTHHLKTSSPSSIILTGSSIWKKRETPFSRIRVQCTDRFNSRIQLDLDNTFLKDFNLKENDLLWVLV